MHLESTGLEKPEEIKKLRAADLVPRAYVIPTLNCALWAFLSHGSLEEVIIAAVNLGGDADSIGAIAGGVAGTYWGFDTIPQRWLSKFGQKQSQRLNSAAKGLWKLAATPTNYE